MKKLRSILMFAAMVVAASCSENNEEENKIKFPDAAFRAVLVADYGLVETDGDINPKDPTNKQKFAEITKLMVDEENLTSLRGLEYFTNITTLNCCINQLTDLDISKNTKLTKLYCDDNQIAVLNVSQYTELIELSCGDNQIAKLDVSKSTKLIQLWCSNNKLTSLDVSKNTALIRFSCSGNQLTSLDITSITGLNFFGFRCGKQLSELTLTLTAAQKTAWGYYSAGSAENNANVKLVEK